MVDLDDVAVAADHNIHHRVQHTAFLEWSIKSCKLEHHSRSVRCRNKIAHRNSMIQDVFQICIMVLQEREGEAFYIHVRGPHGPIGWSTLLREGIQCLRHSCSVKESPMQQCSTRSKLPTPATSNSCICPQEAVCTATRAVRLQSSTRPTNER